MPTAEWLNKYESIKDKLACKTDLDAHFTEKVIGNMGVNVLTSLSLIDSYLFSHSVVGIVVSSC